MVKSKSLYHLALAGVLCAIGIIIPIFSPVKIRLDPMSFTLASHVAIFLAMFISPAVGVAVSVGTTLGFLVGGFTMPVVLRALTHVVWVALGAYYLQKHPELIDFRQQVENRNAKLFGLGGTQHHPRGTGNPSLRTGLLRSGPVRRGNRSHSARSGAARLVHSFDDRLCAVSADLASGQRHDAH